MIFLISFVFVRPPESISAGLPIRFEIISYAGNHSHFIQRTCFTRHVIA